MHAAIISNTNNEQLAVDVLITGAQLRQDARLAQLATINTRKQCVCEVFRRRPGRCSRSVSAAEPCDVVFCAVFYWPSRRQAVVRRRHRYTAAEPMSCTVGQRNWINIGIQKDSR
jgi:hypothetical protein